MKTFSHFPYHLKCNLILRAKWDGWRSKFVKRMMNGYQETKITFLVYDTRHCHRYQSLSLSFSKDKAARNQKASILRSFLFFFFLNTHFDLFYGSAFFEELIRVLLSCTINFGLTFLLINNFHGCSLKCIHNY